LLPFTLVFFTFTVLPVLTAMGYSFTTFNILEKPVFTGLDNYVRLFLHDTDFRLALKNTLVIGCVLATVKPGAVFKNWRIMLTCLARLIVIPGAVFLCLLPFRLDPIVRGIPVLIAGMPAAVFSVILSKEYGGDEKTASVGVFLSTLASSLTIPLISSWL